MKRAVCLISTIGAGILAGCGGGDSTPETSITPTVQTPSKLSKADFISQADGYCAELNAALGSLSNGTTTGSSTTGIEPRADLYQGLLNHLHGLGTPDDETGLDDFFSAGDDVVAAEESLETAQSNGDSAALASAESDAASAEAQFASAASAYGFKECGQGPTTTTPSSSTPSAPATSVPTTPAAPVTTTPAAPATPPGTTGAGGGTAGTGTGTGTGGGSTGSGGTTGGSGGVGPG
jgi:hypothetical protein